MAGSLRFPPAREVGLRRSHRLSRLVVIAIASVFVATDAAGAALLPGPPDHLGAYAVCNVTIADTNAADGTTSKIACQFAPSLGNPTAVNIGVPYHLVPFDEHGITSVGCWGATMTFPKPGQLRCEGANNGFGGYESTYDPGGQGAWCASITYPSPTFGVSCRLEGPITVSTSPPPMPLDHFAGGSSGDYYRYVLPATFGRRLSAAYAADPVDTATGNFTDSSIDLDFPVDGLDWSRTYNARNATSTVLGPGWSAGFGTSVAEDAATGAVTIAGGNGRRATFTRSGSTYTRPEELFATLSKNADATFSLHYDDGRRDDFDASGRLAKRTHWDGQEVTFTYSGGVLVSASHNAGYSLGFEYVLGKLTVVTASDGRSVVYGYTAGLLTSVTDAAGGVTRYAYDGAGRLNEHVDPDDVVIVENVYDADGRVTIQTTPSGDTIVFTYDDVTGTTTVGHQLGGSTTTYRHDQAGRVTSVTDSFGQALVKSYDAAGNLASVADRRNAGLTQTFDGHGNVLSRSGAEGVTESFTYDAFDRLVSATNGELETVTFGYESTERRPTTATDGNGKVTTYDIDATGLVRSVTDADGATLAFGYDSKRNPVSITDEHAEVTELGYDAAGNLASHTTPLGRVTSSTWDGARRLLTSTDPTGGVVTQAWSDAGRLVTSKDEDHRTTAYLYDAAGRLEKVTDALGNETTYGYDVDGNLTTRTRPGNPDNPAVKSVWSATYDELGRMTSETDPTGVMTTYGHDADGNLTTATDENGGVVTLAYDLRGRLVSVTDQRNKKTEYGYDKADRLLSVTDPLLNVTSFAYDDAGRLLTTTKAGGRVWRNTYTDAGRLLTEKDPLDHTTTHGYDVAGRLHTSTDPLGKATTYDYDDDGRLTLVTSQAGLVTAYAYDHLNRRETTTSLAGGVTTRTFTARGQLAVIDEPDTEPKRFFYDDAGRLERVRDPLGRDTTFAYDGRGNVVSRTDARTPTAGVETYTYDLADRPLTRRDPLGRIMVQAHDNLGRLATVSDPSGRSVTYGYDAANRRTSEAWAGGPTIAVAYDDAGRRASVSDGTSTTAFVWDAVDNLTSTTSGGTTLGYGYDLAGNRTSMTYPDGTTATFGFDAADRLVIAAHPQGGTAAYTYDDDGRLLTETLPESVSRVHTYTAGLLTAFSETRGGSTKTTTLAYGQPEHSDRLTSETAGSSTTTYGYDATGELTNVTRGAATTVYGYDEVGNRVRKVVGDVRLDYGYDAAQQLTSVVRSLAGVATGATTYSHDDAGRVTGWSDGITSTSLSYDQRGLLAASATAGPLASSASSTARTYDALGRLASFTSVAPTGTHTTTFGWDSASAVPQAATTASGGVNVNFLWGAGGRAVAIRGGQGDVFAMDAHGSPLAEGTTADLVHGASYDEFGVATPPSPAPVPVLPSAPAATRPAALFGYRGEMALDGFLHLRARDYVSRLGRFTTVDLLPGVVGEVTVANPYHYANNDPLNQVDPLGLSPLRDADVRLNLGPRVDFGGGSRSPFGSQPLWNALPPARTGPCSVAFAITPQQLQPTKGGHLGGAAERSPSADPLFANAAAACSTAGMAFIQVPTTTGVITVLFAKPNGGDGGGGSGGTKRGETSAEDGASRLGRLRRLAGGFEVDGEEYRLNTHVINSLRKSGRRHIDPESLIRSLETVPSPGTPGSRVFTDPETGTRWFVNDANEVVGVWPAGFKG